MRALDVLRSVDFIACEDTRHTRILLDHYGIKTPTTSYYQHNRLVKDRHILGLLEQGKQVALVSDAGTPGILDPGYQLINAALSRDLPVTCIPGPSALVPALVVSGKPAHTFLFAGFLPPRAGARKNRVRELLSFGVTVVCYESCHRLLHALGDIAEAGGDRDIVVCRELTKKFEEIKRGSAQQLRAYFEKTGVRGEFVLVL
jgi:16S rRNA (cytidine1402-2'-O)-methyltransferase